MRIAAREPKPPSDSLSWWARSGRYSLLAVCGYNSIGTDKPMGVTFSILDSHDCWREVRSETCRLRDAEARRAGLIFEVQEMNRHERQAAVRNGAA